MPKVYLVWHHSHDGGGYESESHLVSIWDTREKAVQAKALLELEREARQLRSIIDNGYAPYLGYYQLEEFEVQ